MRERSYRRQVSCPMRASILVQAKQSGTSSSMPKAKRESLGYNLDQSWVYCSLIGILPTVLSWPVIRFQGKTTTCTCWSQIFQLYNRLMFSNESFHTFLLQVVKNLGPILIGHCFIISGRGYNVQLHVHL